MGSHPLSPVRDHPNSLLALNNLSLLLPQKGDFTRPERLHRLVLEVDERSLGEGNFYAINSLHNLALGLDNEGDYAEGKARTTAECRMWWALTPACRR